MGLICGVLAELWDLLYFKQIFNKDILFKGTDDLDQISKITKILGSK